MLSSTTGAAVSRDCETDASSTDAVRLEVMGEFDVIYLTIEAEPRCGKPLFNVFDGQIIILSQFLDRCALSRIEIESIIQ
jgi:hypothetical protein